MKRTVWVVMGNDYPDSVWGSEKLATEYVKEKDEQGKKEHGHTRIYWRSYPFIIQEGK